MPNTPVHSQADVSFGAAGFGSGVGGAVGNPIGFAVGHPHQHTHTLKNAISVPILSPTSPTSTTSASTFNSGPKRFDLLDDDDEDEEGIDDDAEYLSCTEDGILAPATRRHSQSGHHGE